MYKLILNPQKILLKKKQKYFFLGKWFLKFIDKKKLKKINFKYNQDKYFNFNYNKEIKNEKKNRIIYDIILRELYPILNETHSINWSLKTWDFFIGNWLNNYIFLINDRLELIKNLNLSKLNIQDQLNIGKNAWLMNYNLRDFTYDAGLITWNEKLISRIIYLLKTKNFSNLKNIN